MKHYFYIFFILPILFNCQAEKSTVSKYPAHIGDIQFDDKIDDTNFKRCIDKDLGIQYYNSLQSASIQYKGEKIAIIKDLEKQNITSANNDNGYITVRFLVNCNGKTGLFRTQEMDNDYKEVTFNKKFVDQLLAFSKDLTGWLPMEAQGRTWDYYQYLTYKIENGKVSEILP